MTRSGNDIMDRTRNRIVRLWRRGASMRRISRELKVSRYKVKKALTSGRSPPNGGSGRTKRRSSLDDYEGTIRQLLARCPTITVK